MTYCGSCCCHVEPSTDARHGWDHACRHLHEHPVPFVISEKQRERLIPYLGRRGPKEVPA